MPPPKHPTFNVRKRTPGILLADRYNTGMSAAAIDSATRHAYGRMAADFSKVFGARFVALVASPQGAAAAFVAGIDAGDLDALGALSDTWRRENIAPPLVMTPEEFHRSLDTFPAEYSALIDHHVVIAGQAPFDGIQIRPDDLRRACEAQARGLLIHLRQGWIEASSHHGGLSTLLEQSAGPLRALLANLARLHGDDSHDDDALAGFAARVTGMPENLLQSVLALTDAPHRSAALTPRLPEYLHACETLWAFIDRWRGL